MGRRNISGLQRRGGIWHVDKVIDGRRVCQSLGTSNREEAEAALVRFLSERHKQKWFGVRPSRVFREAATKYLLENEHKRSIAVDAMHLKSLDPFIGDLPLDRIHDGTLEKYKAAMRMIVKRRKDGSQSSSYQRKSKSINLALQVVRRILNLAASRWRDENGTTWLEAAPKLTFLPTDDARMPYPLSWSEQGALLAELPSYLAVMVLFKVNTGTREQEVVCLRWDWEVHVPELSTSVFVVPRQFGGRHAKSGVKNKQDRVIVLNRVARSVIEAQRHKHPVWVFPFEGRPLTRMNNTAWNRATAAAAARVADEQGMPVSEILRQLRVHDLKHTFGRRLRAAGVPLETRKVLLGHTTDDITTHYSAAELQELIDAAERVCVSQVSTPTLTVLRASGAGK